MKIRNISIIFTFITFSVGVLSNPIYRNAEKIRPLNRVKESDFASDSESDSDSENNFKIFVPKKHKYLKQRDTSFDWDFTPEKLKNMSDVMLEQGAQIIQELTNIPDDEASFDNVFTQIRKFQDVTSKGEIFNFLLYVYPDVEVLMAADQYLSLFENEMINWDSEIHNKVFKVIDNIKSGKFKAPKKAEDLRYLKKYEDEIKKMGYDLTDEQNQEYAQLQSKLYNNMNKFYSCMGGNPSDLIFTEEELAGVPQNVIDSFERTNNENGEEAYIVSLSNPASEIIVSHAIHGNTRKEYLKARNSKCSLNVEILKDTINIRLKMANILGYSSFSEYKLSDMMAKTPETVFNFLDNIKDKLQPLVQQEFAKKLELKMTDMAELNEVDDKLNYWDINYYDRILKEQEAALDISEVNKYFPIDESINEIIHIYEEFLSITCIENKGSSVWDQDVRKFEVYDKTTKAFIGEFYLDLYSRENKYDGTGSILIKSGYENIDGTRSYPSSALLTSIVKDSPTLLSHDEIAVFIHELGHIFHHLLNDSKWAVFKSSDVQSDFVETPALMTENWAWEPTIIKRISHFYQDATQKIPDELIEAIIKSKGTSVAQDKLYQAFLAYVDLKLHSIEEEDPDFDVIKLWNDEFKNFYMLDPIEGSCQIATFYHIMGGYASSYYSYLWGEVYSTDMYYSKVKPYGILNKKIGRKYRNTVLKPGSSKDAMEIIKEFLGRAPNDEAFIKKLGL